MKRYPYLFLAGITILAITLSYCKKETTVLGPPEASFVVSPENGETTTVFSFDASESSIPGAENDEELFFRWDWDGDGTWDTHFSKSKEYEYRYFSPGSFTATMEVRNVNGLEDTLAIPIEVARGNSAPFPVFTVNPHKGNIRTVFLFDASGTYDDEDSLNTLSFRWDWEGDGIYDTEFSNNPVIEHMFSEAGLHRVVLQVRDPWNVDAKTNKLVDITLNNPRLVAEFTWTPEDGTTADVFTLDASASIDLDDPDNKLQYRWDLNNDGFLDTEWSDNPLIEHVFQDEGENFVLLNIKDQYGLTNSVEHEIIVLHANKPPTATFITGTIYGNLTTEFYFDAEEVRDDEDFYDFLEVRWDFDSDGVYDTEFSREKTARHFYGVEGTFKVTMQVKDSGGLTATSSQLIQISSGTNPTGLIIDEDKNIALGTVKIGEQWWAVENLNVSPKTCYRNSANNCNVYGGLYNWSSTMDGSTSEGTEGICPDGMHVPSDEEWNELFDFLGRENARAELEPGGSTDFRMLYAGQQNATGNFEYAGSVVNFWTSSRLTGNNAWSFSLQAGKDQVWRVSLGQSYKISVRCIKD